jgi:hypothetical protein
MKKGIGKEEDGQSYETLGFQQNVGNPPPV